VISPWTVQDHLRAAFATTDTRSRRELLSRVFFRHQLSRRSANRLSCRGAVGSACPLKR
jgi:hypothetical protein